MNKTILITSGGTREYIDDVRVITNISSGALGAQIAEQFYSMGWRVHYVHAKHGVMPRMQEGVSETARLVTWPIVTVQDLHDTMRSVLTAFDVDLVVHSAAVSDFTFKRDGAVKLSSSSNEDFIEFMRRTITPTPKIIREVKGWSKNPDVLLVGFKFTVGKNAYEMFDISKEMMDKSGCDLVLANDKEEMKRKGEHVMHFVHKGQPLGSGPARQTAYGKPKIAMALYEWAAERGRRDG